MWNRREIKVVSSRVGLAVMVFRMSTPVQQRPCFRATSSLEGSFGLRMISQLLALFGNQALQVSQKTVRPPRASFGGAGATACQLDCKRLVKPALDDTSRSRPIPLLSRAARELDARMGRLDQTAIGGEIIERHPPRCEARLKLFSDRGPAQGR